MNPENLYEITVELEQGENIIYLSKGQDMLSAVSRLTTHFDDYSTVSKYNIIKCELSKMILI
jgi:hypothetical protein